MPNGEPGQKVRVHQPLHVILGGQSQVHVPSRADTGKASKMDQNSPSEPRGRGIGSEGRTSVTWRAGGLISREDVNKEREIRMANSWFSEWIIGVMDLPLPLSFNDLVKACLLLFERAGAGQTKLFVSILNITSLEFFMVF